MSKGHEVCLNLPVPGSRCSSDSGIPCAISWLVGLLPLFNAMMTGYSSAAAVNLLCQAVGTDNRQLVHRSIGLFYCAMLAVGPLWGKMLGSMSGS